ncbi:CheY-like chemotaxis protein [Janthinobacterium sp. CG_23.3]|uniref:response regulator n=1 Tax=unclassified Janthinobacterium TaxID=2610881 RepID=UPI000345305B|nr:MULTISPECIES: response regulator [unclassified Janthinobacterium]MEC5161867.1 CheY-like chemotaxis protein [Janthinobacterium sp. CG_S6]
MNDTRPPPAAPAPMRVLLLDDDAFMLEVLAEMLDQLGEFDVVAAAHAAAALAALRLHRPRLLICDLSLPEMDGIEFLRLAAEAGFDGGVVLLSGMHVAVRKAAERLAEAHGLRLLGAYKKPMERTDLLHMVALQQRADLAAGRTVPA